MKVLAFELSSGKGSIALREGENELFAAEFANDRKHSGLFFDNVQRCLQQFGNPDRIAVGLGPGSYAGTRIAIATAIGLQAATGAELIGIASITALSTDAEAYAVIGDARRQSFWFAEVHARKCVAGPTLCTRTELPELLARARLPTFTSEPLLAFPSVPVLYPSARVLVQLGTTAPAMNAPLEPIYLREPHITQPKTTAV